jgi:lipopolysaccharide biosynthesis protein
VKTVAARVIAFYLPQFHPVDENDAWWGPGFTEWTNVVQARPLFEGHQQPRRPADLGYYDLRVPEVREKQAELASAHGIEAFCYWHYWFEGRRLLARPLDEVLASGKPDFPFCLAWANETWSRRWLGREEDVLISQTYSRGDDVEHARWLAHVFSDERYVRVRGRPLFVVYRPEMLPNAREFVDATRRACAAAGVEDPWLVGTNSHRDADSRQFGFDGTIDWEPLLGAVVPDAEAVYSDGLKVVDYHTARRLMHAADRDYPTYPCVVVSWDNTPRRGGNGVVLTDATPRRLAQALRAAIAQVGPLGSEEQLVFLNAWNEWGEGNYLEPDDFIGAGRLDAVRSVLRDSA